MRKVLNKKLIIMEKSNRTPITVGADQGQIVSVVGDTYRILVSGDQTNGEFATIDMLIPPGGGPGPHAHPDFQETFFVVSGTIEVTSEAGTYIAGPGSYAVIPRGGIVHQFKNNTQAPAHLLCTVVPSGLEKMFLEIGQAAEWGQFLPPPPPDEKNMQRLKASAEKYGQTVYPPDYLKKNE